MDKHNAESPYQRRDKDKVNKLVGRMTVVHPVEGEFVLHILELQSIPCDEYHQGKGDHV